MVRLQTGQFLPTSSPSSALTTGIDTLSSSAFTREAVVGSVMVSILVKSAPPQPVLSVRSSCRRIEVVEILVKKVEKRREKQSTHGNAIICWVVKCERLRRSTISLSASQSNRFFNFITNFKTIKGQRSQNSSRTPSSWRLWLVQRRPERLTGEAVAVKS